MYFLKKTGIGFLPESEFGTVVVAGSGIKINEDLTSLYGIEKRFFRKKTQGQNAIDSKMFYTIYFIAFYLDKKVLCSFVPALKNKSS